MTKVACENAASFLEYLKSPDLWDLSFALEGSSACAVGGGSGSYISVKKHLW